MEPPLAKHMRKMFPDCVSRLIIDGVSNLYEWYNVFFFEESLIDTDSIFAGFVEECFKAKEACPLNSIKEEPFKSSRELKNLEEEPIPVYLNNSNYGAITRQNFVTNGAFPALYQPSPSWPFLAKNLAALLNSNTTPAYNAYHDSWVASVLGDETNTSVIMNNN
jgi:hypothetical protein